MKEKVQLFGRFLSGMVMPNIGAFIEKDIMTILLLGGSFMEDDKIISLYWQRKESAIQETEKKYNRYLMKIAYNILWSIYCMGINYSTFY